MTEQTQNNQKTVLIALDIAKRTHDAIVAFPSGKTIKLRVPNNLDGYRHLLEKANQGDYRI